MKDRYKGMSYGFIVGDMLSAKYSEYDKNELMSLLSKNEKPLSGIELKYWSCNTSFFMALTHSLICNGYGLNMSDLLHRYDGVIKRGRYSVNGNTLNVREKDILAINGNVYSHDNKCNYSSLFRILPIYMIIGNESEILDIANKVYCMFGDEDDGITKDVYDILKVIENSSSMNDVALSLVNTRHDRVLEFNDENISGNMESSVHLFRVALYCLIKTKSFRDSIIMAFSIDNGPDILVPLTAFLAGYYYGYDIPYEWSSQLTNDYIMIIQDHLSRIYNTKSTGLKYSDFTVNF